MPVKSLFWKLALALTLVALFTAGLVAVFIRITSIDSLSRLVVDQQRAALVEALTAYYTQNGSWEGVADRWRALASQSIGPAAQPQANPPPPSTPDRRGLFGLADSNGRVLVANDSGIQPGMQLSPAALKEGTPLWVNGVQVGTLITASRQPGFNPEEDRFLKRTNQALGLAMLGALGVALTAGFLLARTLTRPLRALTRAAETLAQGELDVQVDVRSQDEIGQLSVAFNAMSQEVARVNRLRRQMTADIAHDLRTPLTVIAGYLESMRDGVLQPTPERLALIYSEIERLQDLVGDLRTLSQADAGELVLNLQAVDLAALLQRTATLYQIQAGPKNIRLSVNAEEGLPLIRADEARIQQVLDNLVGNALRHTPPGGEIRLMARRAAGGVRLGVEDTGEGISPEDLPHIFDRFYRGDRARHSEAGETGLGLAIVRAIVTSHGGMVWAESQPGFGTRFYVQIPV